MGTKCASEESSSVRSMKYALEIVGLTDPCVSNASKHLNVFSGCGLVCAVYLDATLLCSTESGTMINAHIKY